MSDVVKVEQKGKVLEITIDSPPANALSRAVNFALGDAFARLRDDPEILVGILTGTGDKIFCAGVDLKECAAEYSPDPNSGKPYTNMVDHMKSYWPDDGKMGGFTEMFDLHKPVITAINGATCGGGFEMALRSDIIVAVEHAEFWFPELRLGILPDFGGIQELPRKIPYNVAAEMMWTGRRMGAEEALRWGLLHKVVKPEELLPTARKIAATIAEAAPLAIEALKEALPGVYHMNIKEAMLSTRADVGPDQFPKVKRMLLSHDFMEGPSAFSEKREPKFKGR